MNTFTEEQIILLAPDAPSLKAGKELANDKKWLRYSRNERVLWGEVQGSGKVPYQTQIDLRNVAFKCSCPSRKFPCKHGLGLFLLFTRQPTLFAPAAPEPDWVQEWMEKRKASAPSAAIAVSESQPLVDHKKLEKQAKDKEKRSAERMSKVAGGVAELERWLQDLLRAGLLSLPEKDHHFWNKTAARMVDAQAAGLGNMVKEFAEIDYLSHQWHGQALQQVTKIHLLTEAFKRMDTLPENLKEDVKNLLGWPQSQKELLENPAVPVVSDSWLVLGKQTEVQEELTILRHWLYGSRTQRYALILNFAYKNAPAPTVLMPATQIEADLVFFPSTFPLRAAIKHQGQSTTQLTPPLAFAHWDEAQQWYAEVLSTNPWVDGLPWSVAQLTPVYLASRWWLKDREEKYLPIHQKMGEQKIFHLLAYSGGKPLNLFVLKTRDQVYPMGAWQNSTFKCL